MRFISALVLVVGFLATDIAGALLVAAVFSGGCADRPACSLQPDISSLSNWISGVDDTQKLHAGRLATLEQRSDALANAEVLARLDAVEANVGARGQGLGAREEFPGEARPCDLKPTACSLKPVCCGACGDDGGCCQCAAKEEEARESPTLLPTRPTCEVSEKKCNSARCIVPRRRVFHRRGSR